MTMTHKTSLFLLGSGIKKDLTALKAADWFAEKYLPKDLSSVNIKFPREKLDYGLKTQNPIMTDKEWEERSKSIKDSKEKTCFDTHKTLFKGGACEERVWTYLNESLETTGTTLLHNYNVSMYCRITAQAQRNQEFDFILLMGQSKRYVHIEVKAGEAGGKDWDRQLERGKVFCMEVFQYLGQEHYKDWKFIPIAAFPNAPNCSEVKGATTFLKNHPDGFILTKMEMEMKESIENRITSPLDPKYEIGDSYANLVKFLIASAYCAKTDETLTLAPLDLIEDAKKKQLGSDANAIGTGAESDLTVIKPSFKNLKEKAVSSAESMLFWNEEQAEVLFSDVSRCIVTGEYGSGKTWIVLEKMKRLILSKGGDNHRGIFISCLLPVYNYSDKFVPPIYNIIMREHFDKLVNNLRQANEIDVQWKFYSAQEICEKMGAPVTEEGFYLNLQQFIKNLSQEDGVTSVFCDEFGDGMIKREWEDTSENHMNEEILRNVVINLNDNHCPEIKSLIISLHPNCDVKAFQHCGVSTIYLKNVMRNTANIYNINQRLSKDKNHSEARPFTILGPQPTNLELELEDLGYYSQALELVSSKKFVCIYPEVNFDFKTFTTELRARNIPLFEYCKKEHSANLTDFLAADEGCFLTRYENLRGAESTTVLAFCDSSQDLGLQSMRASVHLANNLPEGLIKSFSEPEPGLLVIKGTLEDSSLYRKVLTELKKRKHSKFIFVLENHTNLLDIVKGQLKNDLHAYAEHDEPTLEDLKKNLNILQYGCLLYILPSKYRYDLLTMLMGFQLPLVHFIVEPRLLHTFVTIKCLHF